MIYVTILFYLFLLILFIKKTEYNGGSYFSPFSLFYLFLIVFPLLGIFTQFYNYLSYGIQISKYTNIVLVSYLIALFAFLFGAKVNVLAFGEKINCNSSHMVGLQKLRTIKFLTYIVALIGSYIFYKGFSLIQLFLTAPHLARMEYRTDASFIIWYMVKMFSIYFILEVYYIYNFDKNKIIFKYILIFFGILMLGFYGGRFLPFINFLLIIVSIDAFYRHIKLKYIVFGFFLLFLLFGLLGFYRTITIDPNYNLLHLTTDLTDFIINSVSNEYAEFLTTLNRSNLGQYSITDVAILDFFKNLVPSSIFNIFYKIDKTDIETIGGAIQSLSGRNWEFAFGIRVGLIGELYFSFGLLGILIIYFFFGFIVQHLDKFYYSNDSYYKLLAIFAGTFLLMPYPLGIPLIATAFREILFFWLILLFVFRKTNNIN